MRFSRFCPDVGAVIITSCYVAGILQRSGKDISGMDKAAMDLMLAYDWPGNVRELINALEYAVVLCPGGNIQPDHLPESLRHEPERSAPAQSPAAPRGQSQPDERERIIQALQQAGGRREEAAGLLGISRVTLWKKIKAYGIQIENQIK